MHLLHSVVKIFLLTLLLIVGSTSLSYANDIIVYASAGGGGGGGCAVAATCSDTNCPCDKSALYLAYWSFDNALTNGAGVSTCGGTEADCDLTGTTTAFFQNSDCSSSGNPFACCTGSGTGDCIEGNTYALRMDLETDKAECAQADCGSVLSPSATGDYTVGCLHYPDTDGGATNKDIIDNTEGTSQNYKVYRNKSNDDLRGQFRKSGGWETADGPNNGFPVDEWHAIQWVMKNQSGSNQIGYLVLNAAAEADTGAAALFSGANADFTIGSSDGDTNEGLYAGCYVVASALSLDEACYNCACGIKNEYDCLCDDSDATAFQDMNGGTTGLGSNGRNDACNSCLDSISTACNEPSLSVR